MKKIESEEDKIERKRKQAEYVNSIAHKKRNYTRTLLYVDYVQQLINKRVKTDKDHLID